MSGDLIRELAPEIGSRIERMSIHGATEAGLVRLAYTPPWCAAMDEVGSWLQEERFSVRRDGIGNLFGRLDGREAGGVVATGSHLDSIVGGGNYDGVAGVICSFVALRHLARTHGQPRRTLELVAISDEESSRFNSNFWGARAIVGRIDQNELDELVDAEGTSVREAIQQAGLAEPDLDACRRNDIDAFLELHIEQGPVLEQEQLAVGVVSSITGAHWSEHHLAGVGGHAGGTPMSYRIDPMQSAAEMIRRAEEVANELGDPARATVGRIAASPGVPNAIADSVTFSADLRHPDPATFDALKDTIRHDFDEIARRHGTALTSTTHIDEPPTPMSPDLIELLGRATRQLGLGERILASGGGHDSMILARQGIPTAMIFVRCRNGLSHTPAEFASEADLAAGTQVLIEALRELAY